MTNFLSPLVTVVIPTYKTADYLPRSIESLLSQTCSDFELILVCDGGERDYEICDDYALHDERVVVIKDIKKGLGGARNAGLYAARGKYISFLDADDFVDKHFLRITIDRLERSSADFVHCGTIVEYEANYPENIVRGDSEYFKLPYEGLQFFCDDMIGTVDVGVWNKVFNLNFLKKNKIFFPEKIFNEDAYFAWCALVSANKIFFEAEKLYHYVRRDGSMMDSTAFKRKDEDLRLDHLKIALMFYDFMLKKKLLSNHLQAFWNAYIVSVWYVLNNNPEKFRKVIDDEVFSFIRDKDISWLDERKFYDLFRIAMSNKKDLPFFLRIKAIIREAYRRGRKSLW